MAKNARYQKTPSLKPVEDVIRGFFKDFGYLPKEEINTGYVRGLSVLYMDNEGIERILPVDSIKEIIRLAYTMGLAEGKKS